MQPAQICSDQPLPLVFKHSVTQGQSMHNASIVMSLVYLSGSWGEPFKILPWQTLNSVVFQNHSNHPEKERA